MGCFTLSSEFLRHVIGEKARHANLLMPRMPHNLQVRINNGNVDKTVS